MVNIDFILNLVTFENFWVIIRNIYIYLGFLLHWEAQGEQKKWLKSENYD